MVIIGWTYSTIVYHTRLRSSKTSSFGYPGIQDWSLGHCAEADDHVVIYIIYVVILVCELEEQSELSNARGRWLMLSCFLIGKKPNAFPPNSTVYTSSTPWQDILDPFQTKLSVKTEGRLKIWGPMNVDLDSKTKTIPILLYPFRETYIYIYMHIILYISDLGIETQPIESIFIHDDQTRSVPNFRTLTFPAHFTDPTPGDQKRPGKVGLVNVYKKRWKDPPFFNG